MPKIILPISVIVPVANRPRLLIEALVSIQNNTQLPQELIVVFNGIGIEDQAVFKKWLNQNQPNSGQKIHCFEEKRKGASFARNTGIKNAKNDYIAFLDSDDQWKPSKLQLQWEYLLKRPQLKACHTSEIWIKSGKILSQPLRLKPRTGTFLCASFWDCLVSVSSLLIHKKLLEQTDYFNENYLVCEDFDLWLKILNNHVIGHLDKKLTIKRAGNWKQLTNSTHSMDQFRIESILDFVEKNKLPIKILNCAYQSCLTKIQILKKGARKLNHSDGFDRLEKRIQQVFLVRV